jgi:sugar transferase (PEP-CTERM/EpsH1 system associated)
MKELLFLAHRIPYPPDKGEKIRAWHFLEHLAHRYHVHLGCFVDDPRDWAFTDVLRSLCGECCFVRLERRSARLRSLRALLNLEPLTLPYYSDPQLRRWVFEVLRRPALTTVFSYCSAMAQYVSQGLPPRPLRRVADIVDADSEKWFTYAKSIAEPGGWLYRREGRTLREVERRIVAEFDRTLVSTIAEANLVRGFVREGHDRITCVRNGVDSEYYSPGRTYENPYPAGVRTLVFVGAMDYRPNIDAVSYFADAVLPLLRKSMSDLRFFIVGSNPSPQVKSLASSGDIVVTGRVPDVRPYLAHAHAVVAPLRIARGVQNKVLEAMAMARPVIATTDALAGVEIDTDKEVFLADTPEEFSRAIDRATKTESGRNVGHSARERVVKDYAWSASLAQLDGALDG